MIVGLVFIALAFILLAHMWVLAHQDTVEEMELRFKEFPRSFQKLTIFFLSDIHRRSISDQIIQSVTGKADIVVIGGDLTEKGVPLERVKRNLELLKRIGPVYFVWGNNDYEAGYHNLDSMLRELGINILDNRSISLESKTGDVIQLFGVEDVTKQRDRLDMALDSAISGSFKLLVSHDPRITNKLSVQDEIPFVMSGHTHGGQIRIGPLGPYEEGGLKDRGHTTLFVSNGYGTTAIPLRLGVPAKTHLITIFPETDEE